MSNQKKFETLGPGKKSIVDGFKGVDSVRKIKFMMKNMDRFQVTDNNYESLNTYGFGQQGYFQLNGSFLKNVVLQVKLSAGTYVVPNAWGANLIDEIRVKEVGENERVIKGIHNTMLSIREIEKDDSRAEYVSLLGTAATNPTSEIECFIFLNILHSSINPYLSQFYPQYKTASPVQVTIRFNPAVLVLSSGTATMSDVKVHFELGEFADPSRALKNNEEGMHETTYGYEPILIDNQSLNNGAVARTIRLPSFEVSEYDELIAMVVLDSALTTNNYLYGQQIDTKELLISTREIIKEHGNYHKIKSLMKYEKPLYFALDSANRFIHTFDLAPLSYVQQNKSGIHYSGVVLANETIIIKFNTPTNANSTCYIFGIRKVLRSFDGKTVKRYN